MPLDLTIALDAMGGDYGPSEIIPAALFSLKKYKQLNLILVGKEEILREELKKHNSLGHERISISHASEIVTMGEPPSQALPHLLFMKQGNLKLQEILLMVLKKLIILPQRILL